MLVPAANETGASVPVSETHVIRIHVHLMLLFISAAGTSVSSPPRLDCGVRARMGVV
jgi:hypothetical protein